MSDAEREAVVSALRTFTRAAGEEEGAVDADQLATRVQTLGTTPLEE
jgi:hypothetical protein